MLAVATLATLALALRASAFSVSTPSSLTLCQGAKFDIVNGAPGAQYTAYFVHGDNPCGDEIFHLSNLSGDHFNWTVNVTAGTSIMVALDDGTDDEQWSGAVTVTGDDTSCLNGAGTTTTGTTGTTGTTTTQAAAHTAATYTAPVNAASSAPSATSASTSGASRAAVGISSALAVLGVAAVGLTL